MMQSMSTIIGAVAAVLSVMQWIGAAIGAVAAMMAVGFLVRGPESDAALHAVGLCGAAILGALLGSIAGAGWGG
jgi:hypothetical protein